MFNSSVIVLINPLINFIRNAKNLKSNAVVDDLFLFREGWWQISTIIAVYLTFAIVIGPKVMANRKPYDLRGAILVYNIFMVTLNLYFFFASIHAYEFGRALMNFEYPAIDSTLMTVEDERRLYFVYWYFISKIIDLLDTVFFVLRKKWSQVSPLHLYHHSSVPLCVWMAVKYAPTAGVNGIFPILNSAVHVLMYTYYALAAFGPSIQKYLWWKKYITQVQLVQFIIFFIYATTYLFKQTGWPSLLIVSSVAQPPLYLFLFTSFYLNTYCNKTNDKIVSKTQNKKIN